MRLRTAQRSSGSSPLAHVRITQSERQAAEHYLKQGERVANGIMATAAAIQSVLHAVERGLKTLAESR